MLLVYRAGKLLGNHRIMEKIFLIGRVKGDFSDPTALYDKIKEGFPGIRPEEYFRACELI